MRRKIKRNALNRGTAVYLGGSRVRFVWACGCTREEIITSPIGEISHVMTERLVLNWRKNGVVMEQCKKHPDYYNPRSQVQRLNEEHPCPPST